jgi:hypothetical protein
MGGHEQKKRYDGGKTIQIRIEPNKTRTKRYFLWIEENYSHGPHLRGKLDDFCRSAHTGQVTGPLVAVD